VAGCRIEFSRLFFVLIIAATRCRAPAKFSCRGLTLKYPIGNNVDVRFYRRSAIATLAVVAVIVVIVAAAGVGAYYLTTTSSASSSSTTITTKSTSASTTLPLSSTTSAQQTTTQHASTTTTPLSTTTSSSESTTTETSPATTATLVTCTGTYTSYTQTTSSTTVNPLSFDFSFLNQFKALSVVVNSSSGGTPTSEALSYSIVASSGSLKEVNFTTVVMTNSTTENIGSSAWVDVSASSVLNVTESVGGYSYTLTGASAQTLFTSSMIIFTVYQSTFGSAYYSYFISSQYFHTTGTSHMSFGPTSFDVTTYKANNTPEVINTCNNVFTLDDYTLQVGTPPGTTTTFVTKIQFVGSEVLNGVNTQENFTYELTSMTLA
jgi:hypothetical protein